MKLLFYLLPILSLITCSSGISTKNDLNRYGYHGSVKQIVSYKYTNFTGTIDSANFNVRTLYDYNKSGNVHFMQLVINRSMFDQQSTAIDFHYRLKDGAKTGWQEININAKDTSYGTIEWLDETHLFERKYTSANQVLYEISTELDPATLSEKVAEVKQFSNGKLVEDKVIENVQKEDKSYFHIHKNKLTGTQDTVYIDILQKDSLGNATQLIERNTGTGLQNFIRKDFFYY
ncbi:MAG TPA: hypothetical protein DIW47_14740 [Bacteroidetes bacterium]|nr:hypothetical protein [Bacteroidota bacterium]